jgi:hypothetical protein
VSVFALLYQQSKQPEEYSAAKRARAYALRMSAIVLALLAQNLSVISFLVQPYLLDTRVSICSFVPVKQVSVFALLYQ